MEIHPTAIVSKKAELAKGVVIGPYTVIDDHVKIGQNTKVGAHCVITGHTTIGERCEIFTGAVLGSKPQDMKFKGEKSFLNIGDNNTIREYCFFNPGTGEGGKTVIGSNNLFMAFVHVAHDCVVGNGCIMVNNGTLGGHVVLEDYAMVSGLSAVHQFVRIGKMSIIGGCSKAVQDIPPFSTSDGHPARVFGLNLIGLKRHGVSLETVRCLKKAFRVLFNSGLPVKRAIEQIDPQLLANKEVSYLVKFIESSSRGIAHSARVDNDTDSENNII